MPSWVQAESLCRKAQRTIGRAAGVAGRGQRTDAEGATGEYHENTMRIRREYEENTMLTPEPPPSIRLALGLLHAFPADSAPRHQVGHSGIPGKIAGARTKTRSFHPLSASHYLLWLGHSHPEGREGTLMLLGRETSCLSGPSCLTGCVQEKVI